jgi:hypothetical protein
MRLNEAGNCPPFVYEPGFVLPPKPITPETLLPKVRSVLDRA